MQTLRCEKKRRKGGADDGRPEGKEKRLLTDMLQSLICEKKDEGGREQGQRSKTRVTGGEGGRGKEMIYGCDTEVEMCENGEMRRGRKEGNGRSS